MPIARDIGSAAYGDMTNVVEDVTVDARTTDAATGQGEYTWTNAKWTQYFGYYNEIPEVNIAINTRAMWVLGNGYEADTRTTVILDRMKGWGEDTFNDILTNMSRTSHIGGDAFSEIIRDGKGLLLNIKPLDPATISIVTNSKGMLIRYEQRSKVAGSTGIKKYKPDQILHLMNNRIADQVHGISDIAVIEKIIKARNEGFADMQELMHRFVRPKFATELDTDDEAAIAAFIEKFDKATNKGENLFYPKGTAKSEILSIPANATLNPLPWFNHLKDYFYQVSGIPQIIMGSSGEFTESTAKIAFTAFEQSVKAEQRSIEEQVLRQLFLTIKLNVSVTLRNELLTDTAKDGQNQQLGEQPNDTTAGVGA